MEDDLEIPQFLRREDTPREKAARAVTMKLMAKASSLPPRGEPVRAQLNQQDLDVITELAATKKAKAKARISKFLATKNGAAQRMPVQGKAALKLIAGKGPPPESEAPSTQRGEQVKDQEPIPAAPVGVEGAAVEQSAVAEPKKEKTVKSKKKASNNARTPVGNGHNGKETKTQQIVEMLRGKHGVTTPEVLAAVGWPSVSMDAVARAAGIKLKKEKNKGEKHTRYFAA